MEANERLQELYRKAVAAAVVRTQKEFAELIETPASTLSNCLKGVQKYKGTVVTLVGKAEQKLSELGVLDTPVAGDGSGNSHSDVSVNSSDVILRMLTEISAQREEYIRLIDQEREHAKKIHEDDVSTINRLLTLLEPRVH